MPVASGDEVLRFAQDDIKSMPLEVLYGAFVFFGGGATLEGAEIAALAGLGVGLARIETILTRGQFADHGRLLVAVS
jgi:hypothetical protein